jgi:hypothetical protein
MAPRGGRQTVDMYFKALNERRLDDVVALMHPEIVMQWPQSGERFRGRDKNEQVVKNYPGLPKGEMTSLTGAEDRWVLTPSWTALQVVGSGDDYTIEGFVTYPNGERWAYVAVFHLRDGLVYRLTEYFGAPFPPAEWRARWAEKMEMSAGSRS